MSNREIFLIRFEFTFENGMNFAIYHLCIAHDLLRVMWGNTIEVLNSNLGTVSLIRAQVKIVKIHEIFTHGKHKFNYNVNILGVTNSCYVFSYQKYS